MNDELFQQLAASVGEGGAILRGTEKPARSAELRAPSSGWRNVILKQCSMPCTGESGRQRLPDCADYAHV
ncbi:MAG: hypothetical protein EOP86_14440 [Verrucomicrobiaceae bacterium]|nr:MAG: hypothetical protein EOP86_14440 [Verrucomicrobiaceae bacterium]